MAWTYPSRAQLRTMLALRLSDPNFVHWASAELDLYLDDALRLWNALTCQNLKWTSLTLSTSIGIWYDFNILAASPRRSTLTDANLYTRLQYMLLEPPASNAVIQSGQFTASDLVNAVQKKRDEFLLRTGATKTVETIAVTPNVPTLSLPEAVLQAVRGYWLQAPLYNKYPSNYTGSDAPLMRSDEMANVGYQADQLLNPDTPRTFAAGTEPPLTVDLTPPPSIAGSIEFLCIENQGTLSASTPTTIYLPDDLTPGLAWGALGDLLDSTPEKMDATRAKIARQRFEQYVELCSVYPFIISTRVNNLPLMIDSVESLDSYNPTWRVNQNTPVILPTSGQNLLAVPSPSDMTITLYVLASADLSDPVQLGKDALDSVLDLAEAHARFKEGASEAADSLTLVKGAYDNAAKVNSRVRALSSFRDMMMAREQREIEPEMETP